MIVLDMDATDDPTHAQQQLSFFQGYYEEHMYHPLLVFGGRTGFPVAAILRPGNTHASHGALSVLKRVIKKLKKAYPGALIFFRANAGFAVPAVYRYLERQEIRYVTGFITNQRVLAKAAPFLEKTQRQYRETGEKQRLFTSFSCGEVLDQASPDHRQGGVYPPGRQSALRGHQPGSQPAVRL